MARLGTPAPSLTLGWTVALAAVVTLAALAVAPPLLGPEAGAATRHAFAGVCHQIPERSFHLAGGPVALCHRCSGVLAGLLLGVMVAPGLGGTLLAGIRSRGQGAWLVAAALPTALDWALGALGWWSNTPGSRAVTGAVFGIAAGAILAANLLAPRRSPSPSLTHSV